MDPFKTKADDKSHDEQQDLVEAIVPYMHILLPIVGGVLIFMLAFIAVFLA
jgi:hypothetical protein